jgi:hypothetical protein
MMRPWRRWRRTKALMESGNMTKKEFIANTVEESGCKPCSSSFMINFEMRNDEWLFHRGVQLASCKVEIAGRMG